MNALFDECKLFIEKFKIELLIVLKKEIWNRLLHSKEFFNEYNGHSAS